MESKPIFPYVDFYFLDLNLQIQISGSSDSKFQKSTPPKFPIDLTKSTKNPPLRIFYKGFMDYTVEVLTREEQPSRVDEVHDYENFGELVADKLAAGIGSWTFILVQTAGIILWVIANVCAFKFHWDPYPFILMNLMFSVQAAYTGPILLLAANRAAKKDRIRDDRDDQEIGEILAIVRELKSKSNL